MNYFPEDHPLSEFNDYLYLESGTYEMPIYIFKKDNVGILAHYYLPKNKVNIPRVTVYLVNFFNDYDWVLDRKTRVIENQNILELNDTLANYIRSNLLHG